MIIASANYKKFVKEVRRRMTELRKLIAARYHASRQNNENFYCGDTHELIGELRGLIRLSTLFKSTKSTKSTNTKQRIPHAKHVKVTSIRLR